MGPRIWYIKNMANDKTYDHVVTLKQDCREIDYGAAVELDGETVMMGGPEDFYPGCHGIHEWGPFKGADSLAHTIRLSLEAKGKTVKYEEPVGYFDETGNWAYGEYSEPVEPTALPPKPKAKLSKRVRELLSDLDKTLNELDRIQLRLAEDCDVMDELDGADPEILEAWEAFDDTIHWRKYHFFLQALRRHTDYK